MSGGAVQRSPEFVFCIDVSLALVSVFRYVLTIKMYGHVGSAQVSQPDHKMEKKNVLSQLNEGFGELKSNTIISIKRKLKKSLFFQENTGLFEMT